MSTRSNRSLLVIGVHKGGTTSLYKYLGDHPAICQPLQKELHFFTPLVYGQQTKSIEVYYKNFTSCTDNQYLLDVSPSYLYGSLELIQAISALNEPKIIVVLRNPVERFISFYKQGISSGRIDRKTDLSTYISQAESEFRKFEQDGIQKDTFENRGLREGCYALYLQEWMDHFRSDFKIVLFDDLIQNQKEILNDICAWLTLDPVYDNYEFTNENTSFTPKSQGLSTIANKFFLRFERFFRRNARLKNFFKRIYRRVNKGEGFNPQQKDIDRLKKFYDPYNQQLNQLFEANNMKKTDW